MKIKATLIVLLAIRIVLSNLSGLLCSLSAFFAFVLLIVLNDLRSSGLSERYATSEADIKAEPIRRIKSTGNSINKLRLLAFIEIPVTNVNIDN